MLKNERAPPAATERGSKSKLSETKNTPALSVVSSIPLDDFEIADSPLSLVPPGTYSVCYVGHWTGVMFQKQPKLALNFKVVSVGEHFGATLSRWYNAKRLMGHHGTSGRFQVGRRSDLLAEFMLLNASSKAPAR